jgi:Lectin C-type domain
MFTSYDFQYSSGNWWVGASDNLAEGTWTTNSSGSSQWYKNWNSGEPNGGTNENCILMDAPSGKWIDISCSNSYWTLCEKVVQMNPKGIYLHLN